MSVEPLTWMELFSIAHLAWARGDMATARSLLLSLQN